MMSGSGYKTKTNTNIYMIQKLLAEKAPKCPPLSSDFIRKEYGQTNVQAPKNGVRIIKIVYMCVCVPIFFYSCTKA